MGWVQFIPLSLKQKKQFHFRYHKVSFYTAHLNTGVPRWGFLFLNYHIKNKCALFFISLVKSYYCPYYCLGGGVLGGWDRGWVLSMTHKLCKIFCLIMLATSWSVSLHLWWCYSKHFDYLNVLRCQKTKQGRKILLIKICCCQGNCKLKQGFRNPQDPSTSCISQYLTALKRECFKNRLFSKILCV